MLTIDDILKYRDSGETSKLQFKERIIDKYDIGCELVAFSNARGGRLIIGINDKTGDINALSYQEVQETTNMLSNIASENVVPNTLLDIETVAVNDGSIIVVHVKEGINKPYHDNKGIVWMKNGADKRKVFDNAELAEMMSECGSFDPDEAAVKHATIDDLDEATIKTFLKNKFSTALERKGLIGDSFKEATLDQVAGAIVQGHNKEQLLRNLRFIRPDGNLTTAAILLFGKYTQRWLPTITAKCISFVGNDVGGTQFKDKVHDTDMEGNLLHQFETIMSFFKRNLKTIQVESEFNSLGEMEIPYICLVELVVNALVHRSLNRKSPIRIFIFDNRVEIHSPGTLSNGLTIDDIVAGTSMPRNNFLFANAIYLLPYTGAGSGIQRALSRDKKISFVNNESLQEFIITIARDNVLNLDTIPNTLGEDLDTKKQDLDTTPNTLGEDLDTFKIKLSNKQKDIINFCTIPRSSREILERIGVSNHSKNKDKYIKSLIDSGYLEMTNPANPNASNQKYRKKAKK